MAKMYLMSWDAKWMEKEVELDFTPFPGLSLDGLVGDETVKINTMSYDVGKQSV
jgi:hypothetical protein